MKKLLFAILSVVGLNAANAQITLTSADSPVAGDMFVQSHDTVSTGITPGPAGENVTWDFSMLQQSFVDTVLYVDAASIPESSNFPSANLAEINSSDTNFIASTTNDLTFLGFLSGGIVVKMDDPLIGMQYPYTYGTNFSDEGHFQVVIPYDTTVNSVQIDSVRFDETINSTDSCIAYGTLILPGETINDALFNKNVSQNHDVVSIHTSFGWMDVRDTTYTTNSFSVYTNGYHQSLLDISMNDDGTISSASYKYNPANYVETQNGIKVSIYPNPAKNNLNIETPEANSSVTIYNLNGQQIISKKQNNNNFSINISTLPEGNYIIKINTPRGTIVKKFIKN